MADNLEALIQAEGPATIAAFFAEPVQGGGGAITPPLVITEAEIGEMCRRFGRGLDAAWAELREARAAAE